MCSDGPSDSVVIRGTEAATELLARRARPTRFPTWARGLQRPDHLPASGSARRARITDGSPFALILHGAEIDETSPVFAEQLRQSAT